MRYIAFNKPWCANLSPFIDWRVRKDPLTGRWARYNLLKFQGQISKPRAFCDAIID